MLLPAGWLHDSPSATYIADEQRNVGMLRDEGQREALGATLALCRQLAVSYAGLTLLMGMFPQVRPSSCSLLMRAVGPHTIPA